MFSKAQKKAIAASVEKILLDLNDPEMPKEHPYFRLRVEGKDSYYNWADISPNWVFEGCESLCHIDKLDAIRDLRDFSAKAGLTIDQAAELSKLIDKL